MYMPAQMQLWQHGWATLSGKESSLCQQSNAISIPFTAPSA